MKFDYGLKWNMLYVWIKTILTAICTLTSYVISGKLFKLPDLYVFYKIHYCI